MKELTLKNKQKQKLFRDFKTIPKPIVTRWGIWLEAVKYYSENFNEIKKIVFELNDDGLLNKNAKKNIFCRWN